MWRWASRDSRQTLVALWHTGVRWWTALMVSQLLGLEESVHSWLPQGSTETPYSPPSSEELARIVIDAVPLEPMKSKVKPSTEKNACAHRPERLTVASNQHNSWVVCWDCHGHAEGEDQPSSQSEGGGKEGAGQSASLHVSFGVGGLCQDAEGGSLVGAAGAGSDRAWHGTEARDEPDAPIPEAFGTGDGGKLPRSTALAEGFDPSTEYGSPSGDHGVEGEASGSSEGRRSDRVHDGRVCRDGSGAGLPGEQSVSQWRDVEVCREQASPTDRAGSVEQVDNRAGAGGLGKGPISVSRNEEQLGEKGLSNQGQEQVSSQEVWVKLRGDGLKEAVTRWQGAPGYEPKEVYVQQDAVYYKIENYEDLLLEDECMVWVGMTAKAQYEELVEDATDKETALAKSQKTRLRRALQSAEGGAFSVEVSEVFSPPRITLEAKRQGLSAGGSYDISTGYNLLDAKDKKRMWDELDRDDPELVVNSPPCTAFSPLQEWNFPRMDLEKAMILVGDGLEHLWTASDVACWQHQRGKVFLFEHPRPSKAWEEEPLQRLMELDDIYVCTCDMCAFGMKVNEGLNKKSTRWVTDSWHIAMELQKRYTGDHDHEPLTHGKAAMAGVYPPQLCKAIFRGLKRHLRWKYGTPVKLGEADVVLETFATETGAPRPEDDLEDPEELLPEEVRVFRAEKERLSRIAAVAVSDEDKAKVTKMHANLGHPSKESFVRFLRAGRVREEVVRWYIKEFRCATCESHALPKAPRPAVVPKCYRPGVAVGIDLFYIPDPMNQKSLPVLNIVDLGTNCQMIQLIGNKSPFTIWRAFWKTWCRTFGMPQFVSLDAGLEFRGDFTRWCANFGTLVFRAAARSPWQQGKVERHGGLMKNMIEKARESTSVVDLDELKALLYECEAAKNRFMNRSGYSPVQRQIGQWPRLPGSLMSDEFLDPALQVQSTTEEFDRTLELRQIAQDAFVKLASKEAAAKALRSRRCGVCFQVFEAQEAGP